MAYPISSLEKNEMVFREVLNTLLRVTKKVKHIVDVKPSEHSAIPSS